MDVSACEFVLDVILIFGEKAEVSSIMEMDEGLCSCMGTSPGANKTMSDPRGTYKYLCWELR